jgi:hypothetical protein
MRSVWIVNSYTIYDVIIIISVIIAIAIIVVATPYCYCIKDQHRLS